MLARFIKIPRPIDYKTFMENHFKTTLKMFDAEYCLYTTMQ
jgi:hypothetical protein